MTKPMSAETAGAEIRYELNKLPGRIVTGVGARERLRKICHLTPSQFAKGLIHNLAAYNEIFIVINERRNGSTYLITQDADLAWTPIADDVHYIQRRTESLAKKVSVVEEDYIAKGAPIERRSAVYATRAGLDSIRAQILPLERQTGIMAGKSEKKIEAGLRPRWNSATR
jgi:hypothetical protein